ncbi:MAG: 3-hydroxyacyl-ACP dehydratase FabZ family protein [Planctomycetota bacterium]
MQRSRALEANWQIDKLSVLERPGNLRQLGNSRRAGHRNVDSDNNMVTFGYDGMKYRQIDRITLLEPGKKIVGTRTLRADEEALRDHFPRFAVMPGVMMLEALHQAAIWMIRTGEDFAHPLVLLREARNVKFGDFLAVGETLEINAEVTKEQDQMVTVKATAQKEGKVTVSAKLVFERCGSNEPSEIGTDDDVRARARQQFRELYGDILGPANIS